MNVPQSTEAITAGQTVRLTWYRWFVEIGRLVTRHLAGDSTTQVIDGGVITLTRFGLITVDTEGAAATDDLDTINGSIYGAVIVLRQAADTRDVTVKDGTGNLSLAGDCAFTDADDTITLVGTGTGWLEMCRSNNA